MGYPKTATTYLQKEILPAISSIDCYSMPSVDIYELDSISFSSIFHSSPAIWENIGDKVFSFLRNAQKESISGKRNVLVSDEGMLGGMIAPDPWIPRYKSGYLPPARPHQGYEVFSTCSHLAELSKIALKWMYSPIKVLVTIRRQDKRLASSYAQLSNRVRGASQKNFESWVNYLLYNTFGYYRGGGVKLNYNLLWTMLDRVVGCQNVLFLPFELLEKDPSEFLRRWFDFLGIQKEGEYIISNLNNNSNRRKWNVRSKAYNEWVLQKDNYQKLRLRPARVFKKLGLPTILNVHLPDFNRENKICITPELKENILRRYRKENKILDASLNNVDLYSYGYY